MHDCPTGVDLAKQLPNLDLKPALGGSAASCCRTSARTWAREYRSTRVACEDEDGEIV